jgi:hypothetical protein
MAIAGRRVTVTDAATLVVTGMGDTGRFKLGAKAVTVKNKGANPCSLGAANVTFAGGYEIAVNDAVNLDQLGDDEALYARCNTGLTTTLHVLEVD